MMHTSPYKMAFLADLSHPLGRGYGLDDFSSGRAASVFTRVERDRANEQQEPRYEKAITICSTAQLIEATSWDSRDISASMDRFVDFVQRNLEVVPLVIELKKTCYIHFGTRDRALSTARSLNRPLAEPFFDSFEQQKRAASLFEEALS
jgi:hypothetical protein